MTYPTCQTLVDAYARDLGSSARPREPIARYQRGDNGAGATAPLSGLLAAAISDLA